MPFAPWLTQPDDEEEKLAYDPDDPSLLVNILKPDPGDKPIDWFLDHLVAETPPKDV